MASVAEIFRRYGAQYLERFGAAMPAEHRKVLSALQACRTGELGTVHYACPNCAKHHVIGRSCGNRHCPTCQQHKTKAWLERQKKRLLPCPYFLVTFTVPRSLRKVLRRHQRIGYAALFEASSAALKTLAADPKYIGTRQPGFFGVLHTWGRQLQYHPHVHYVVPGGGLSDDGQHWLPSSPTYYVNVKALSILFRAKFRDILARAGLLDKVDPAVWRWRHHWVVHSKAVGDGRASLKYLAPYVFRVAISDRRIRSCEDGRVVFDYRPSGSKKWQSMTLDAEEFIRRFLQHVLPTGFVKVRHYGFLSSRSSQPLEAVKWLVAAHYLPVYYLWVSAAGNTTADETAKAVVTCPQCGHPLHLIAFVPFQAPILDSS